jgi:mRNA interferase RelE/StbE
VLYRVLIMPKALKDLRKLPRRDAERVLDSVDSLADNLKGDVKRLTNFAPAYRLRSGDYRVLFDVESQTVLVRRILHRKDAYS